jgi:octaprenyl-diphosphate synthase
VKAVRKLLGLVTLIGVAVGATVVARRRLAARAERADVYYADGSMASFEADSPDGAALFAAACRIAPVVAEAGEEAEVALEKYGKYLGIAFQLVDDVLDYGSKQDIMGKGVGDDFRDGKVTLPVILAYARGSDEDRAFWRDAMLGERISDEDLTHAIALLRGTDALSETIERARLYGRRALDALAQFPAGKAKSALSEAVEFAISRAY